MGYCFQGVTHRVSKIQYAARQVVFAVNILPLVAGDNRRFETTLRLDQRFKFSKAQRACLFVYPGKKSRRVLKQPLRSTAPFFTASPPGGQRAGRVPASQDL
jgi:hypothetical protein